jgi:hypothetical protein
MSIVFKRPMFRGGGDVGGGIMTGIRQNFADAGSARERLMKVMEEYPTGGVSPASQYLISTGLDLISRPTSGNVLADVAASGQQNLANLFEGLGAEQKLKRELALAGEKLDIEQEQALEVAKAKALGESGYLKEETSQRAYEDLVKERTKSAGTLTSFQKPNLEQKFPRTTAEYDSYILRNLRTTENPKGQEIERNNAGFVPFDAKTQTFDYEAMLPNKYYFDPRSTVKSFVVRKVEDGEEKFFAIDPYTFQEVLIEQNR